MINQRKHSNRWPVVAAGAWLLLVAGNVFAADIEGQFSAGIGHSDNIARTADNQVSETIGVAGMSIGISEESSRWTADIRSQIDYFHYADGTFDDELVGGLAGFANFTLVDERLRWVVEDTFGQQTVDPLTTAGPGNREDVNFFTTGPTINFLPGSRNTVQVDLRYSSVNFEERDTDNERMSAALRLGREVRRGASLSLNASTEQVEFDNGGLSRDFDRNEAFLRYQVAGSRNTVGIDAGYTQIDFDDETRDGVLARLSWTREVSPNVTFRMSGGTNYSDQGNIFQFNQNNAADLRDTVDDINSPEPFVNNFLTLSYNLDRGRTSAGFGLSWNQQDVQGASPLDRDTSEARFNIGRDLSRDVFASLGFRYQRRDFKNIDVVDDNHSINANIGYRFGPSSNAVLEYRYTERSGDSAFAVSRENRFFLRFFYTPAWGR